MARAMQCEGSGGVGMQGPWVQERWEQPTSMGRQHCRRLAITAVASQHDAARWPALACWLQVKSPACELALPTSRLPTAPRGRRMAAHQLGRQMLWRRQRIRAPTRHKKSGATHKARPLGKWTSLAATAATAMAPRPNGWCEGEGASSAWTGRFSEVSRIELSRASSWSALPWSSPTARALYTGCSCLIKRQGALVSPSATRV